MAKARRVVVWNAGLTNCYMSMAWAQIKQCRLPVAKGC